MIIGNFIEPNKPTDIVEFKYERLHATASPATLCPNAVHLRTFAPGYTGCIEWPHRQLYLHAFVRSKMWLIMIMRRLVIIRPLEVLYLASLTAGDYICVTNGRFCYGLLRRPSSPGSVAFRGLAKHVASWGQTFGFNCSISFSSASKC